MLETLRTSESYDVVIIGSGIAGLMAAQKLSDIGMRVALVELQKVLASGPSTRNEGWLHRGTYHAASIRDRSAAIQVARRCIYGHDQLRRFCPEAVEDSDLRPFALIGGKDKVDEVVSRWREADVQFRPISASVAQKFVPDADLGKAAAIFEASDVSINTRLLYRKLFALAKKAGCEFLLGHEIEQMDGSLATLRDGSGKRLRLEASKFVYAAGTGTRAIFHKLHGVGLPIRYWKSHLIVTKRLAPVGVFFIDPHEAAMMHHGDVSIVGFNEDAFLCSEPSYEVVAERAANLRAGIARLFPKWAAAGSVDIACTKIDLAATSDVARSLNIAITEPIDGHICILPGKMTEAPFLTDTLTAYLHRSLDDTTVSLRPCDHFLTQQSTTVLDHACL